MMNRFIAHNMPKIELHCHLDGSVSLPLIQKLMQQEGKEPLGLEELREKLVAPMDCSSLAEYLEKFELPLGCLQTKEGLSAAAQDLALSAAKEQVKYLEVRFAPAFSMEQGLSVREILESVRDGLKKAEEKGEPPFIILLDNIEDPHNLGAIIRTANLAGAHGVIIPKNRAAGLTATVARTSAGALNYTPVAKVTNLAKTIEELKKEGLWFVCADMGGTTMYDLNLKGPIGLVIGNEGEGVGRLVKEKCDMVASIPMKGDIDSLNASVAAGVLAYEIVRQRLQA